MCNHKQVGTQVFLDVYGLVVSCRTASPDLIDDLARPFRYFIRENATPIINVVVQQQRVPYDTFPALDASFLTPRNVVYEGENQKIIDYFGKGAVVVQGNEYTIYGDSANFLCEAFYLLMLSLLGQHCDKKGYLRIHALSVSYKERALIMMLPQGGGKSTMAFRLMKEPEFRYISDDDPIIDDQGRVMPFPRPLGTLDQKRLATIPEQFVYAVDRMEFGIKYYIDCDYWGNRIEQRYLSDVVLFVGKRVLNRKPSIKPISKFSALKTLFRDAVVGVGLYQGLEFILNHSSWDALTKIPVLMKRLMLAIKLARHAETFEFTLTNDPSINCETIQEFLLQLGENLPVRKTVLTPAQTSGD